MRYLEREMDLMKPLLNPKRKVVQLHFGGGTPTFLGAGRDSGAGGDRSMRGSRWPTEVEAGVEVDPRRLTRDHLMALREVGFNRASMGVQDNDPVVQKAVHRIQPFEMTRQVVEWMRETGFHSVNIDLIYGLPYQTPRLFVKTLEETLSLRPDRFAVFNYAHVPWMKPAQKILKVETLPTPETKLELLKLTIEKLTAEGYVYIGMDHFALAGDELAVAQRQKTLQRNFQGYSTRGGADIYAFGMSSISQAEGFYWQNHKELPEYYAALDAGKLPAHRGYVMTEEDKLRRVTIMRLMCDLGLDYEAMSKLLGLDFKEHFAHELDSLDDMEADGLLVKTPQGLIVTDLGRLFISPPPSVIANRSLWNHQRLYSMKPRNCSLGIPFPPKQLTCSFPVPPLSQPRSPVKDIANLSQPCFPVLVVKLYFDAVVGVNARDAGGST